MSDSLTMFGVKKRKQTDVKAKEMFKTISLYVSYLFLCLFRIGITNCLLNIKLTIYSPIPGVEFSVRHMSGKDSTMELYPQAQIIYVKRNINEMQKNSIFFLSYVKFRAKSQTKT